MWPSSKVNTTDVGGGAGARPESPIQEPGERNNGEIIRGKQVQLFPKVLSRDCHGTGANRTKPVIYEDWDCRAACSQRGYDQRCAERKASKVEPVTSYPHRPGNCLPKAGMRGVRLPTASTIP